MNNIYINTQLSKFVAYFSSFFVCSRISLRHGSDLIKMTLKSCKVPEIRCTKPLGVASFLKIYSIGSKYPFDLSVINRYKEIILLIPSFSTAKNIWKFLLFSLHSNLRIANTQTNKTHLNPTRFAFTNIWISHHVPNYCIVRPRL